MNFTGVTDVASVHSAFTAYSRLSVLAPPRGLQGSTSTTTTTTVTLTTTTITNNITKTVTHTTIEELPPLGNWYASTGVLALLKVSVAMNVAVVGFLAIFAMRRLRRPASSDEWVADVKVDTTVSSPEIGRPHVYVTFGDQMTATQPKADTLDLTESQSEPLYAYVDPAPGPPPPPRPKASSKQLLELEMLRPEPEPPPLSERPPPRPKAARKSKPSSKQLLELELVRPASMRPQSRAQSEGPAARLVKPAKRQGARGSVSRRSKSSPTQTSELDISTDTSAGTDVNVGETIAEALRRQATMGEGSNPPPLASAAQPKLI